ncbi:MAG TPA: hypothetical protein DEP05_03600 [Betaproteobacteria bacterium]|nr:hypothetical protein [Betaproteobacteria bacterium]
MNEGKDKYAHEIKNDGGILTGSTIVGGAALIYHAGKDVYSWFTPKEKLFIQLLESRYDENHHIIKARFASAHIHGIYIESLYLKNSNPKDIQTFLPRAQKMDWGQEGDQREVVNYPHLLLPGDSLDVNIALPELTDTKIIKNKGTELVCDFSLLDKLGAPETISVPTRLRWASP